MDQYCIHNGIPLGAHFIYLNFDSILAWRWLYLAETCRCTKNWYCHFMIRIVVFVDWPIYYCIDITQCDGSYQISWKWPIFGPHFDKYFSNAAEVAKLCTNGKRRRQPSQKESPENALEDVAASDCELDVCIWAKEASHWWLLVLFSTGRTLGPVLDVCYVRHDDIMMLQGW
jgi:hypothetical protein